MKKLTLDWARILDVCEDLALELAEAAIRARRRQKGGRRRLK